MKGRDRACECRVQVRLVTVIDIEWYMHVETSLHWRACMHMHMRWLRVAGNELSDRRNIGVEMAARASHSDGG
jgi:hypothetical protein